LRNLRQSSKDAISKRYGINPNHTNGVAQCGAAHDASIVFEWSNG